MSETEQASTPESVVGAKYAKKLTVSSMCGSGGIPRPLEGQTIWLVSLYGTVNKIETGSTEYGEFMRMSGEVMADSLVTGESKKATSVILPAIAEQLVRNHLTAVGFGQENGEKQVTFAMDIGVEYNKSSGTGYTWVVKPVGATQKTPLEMYRDQIKARRVQEALAAPAPQKTIEGTVDSKPDEVSADKSAGQLKASEAAKPTPDIKQTEAPKAASHGRR